MPLGSSVDPGAARRNASDDYFHFRGWQSLARQSRCNASVSVTLQSVANEMQLTLRCVFICWFRLVLFKCQMHSLCSMVVVAYEKVKERWNCELHGIFLSVAIICAPCFLVSVIWYQATSHHVDPLFTECAVVTACQSSPILSSSFCHSLSLPNHILFNKFPFLPFSVLRPSTFCS